MFGNKNNTCVIARPNSSRFTFVMSRAPFASTLNRCANAHARLSHYTMIVMSGLIEILSQGKEGNE